MFEEFEAKEREGWGARAAIYADTTARITTQSIPMLLAAVRTRVGMRLLDICTGPGFAAGAAAAVGADADGVDFAPEMVSQAAANFPACRFFEGDALALPCDDAGYDAAVCPFGVFHFTDVPTAFVEARRILRPGGRYAFSQWCSPADSDLFRLMLGAIAKHADMSGVPPAPDAFAYSDPKVGRAALTEAGFVDIEVHHVPSVYHPPEGDFFDNVMRFSVRMPMIYDAQTPDVQTAIREEVNAGLAPYRSAAGIVVPAPAFVMSGVAA